MNAAQSPLDALPGLPRDAEGPVFEQPWQAHAFAMTVSLHERGVFTWPEWSNALSQEIRSAAHRDEPNHGETYYLHWLKALEALVAVKGVETVFALADSASKADERGSARVIGSYDVAESVSLANASRSRESSQLGASSELKE